MAIAQGNNTENQSNNGGNNFARYTGVGEFQVIAINPTGKEMSEIYGREIDREFEYLTETEDKVKKIELKFVVKYAGDIEGIDFKDRIMYFLENRPRYNKDQTKVQVINAYGDCTWLSIENAKAGEVPENMMWYNTKGIRAAYVGEEDLTKFIKSFLSIPDRTFMKDGRRVEIKDPALAECQFEKADLQKLFTGDIKAIKQAISSNPNNKFKCLVGVKTTDDNKLYQVFAKEAIMKFGARKYDWFIKQVKERQESGAYSNVDFGTSTDFKQYELKATDFINQDKSEDVFSTTTNDGDDDPWGVGPQKDNSLPF